MYIDHKLGLGFGAMVSLVLLLAGMAWQDLRTLSGLEKEKDRLVQMQESLLEARRNEKNFLLRHDQSWVELNRNWMERLDRLIREQQAVDLPSNRGLWQEAAQRVRDYLECFGEIASEAGPSISDKAGEAETRLVPLARRLHALVEGRIASQTQSQREYLSQAERFYAGFVVFAMVLSGLLVFLVTRAITSSLKVGIRFAEEIASGNLQARMGTIPRDEIGILLSAMQRMGEDLQRLEEGQIRSLASRLAMSALLETSLEPLSLARQMEVALHIILTIPWLHLQNKGAFFLVGEKGGPMQLIACHGLVEGNVQPDEVVDQERHFCERVAAEGRLLFSPWGDAGHDTHGEGFSAHGHYGVPIFLRGRVQAVMLLYLDSGHIQNAEEEDLLASLAFTLAGILERKGLEERLQHLAHHDLLTGLPNRVLFAEHLSQSLALATRTRDLLALMLVDLDRFKEVNDTLGHAAGDQVLVTATQRIRECLRASDLVARMGGDEFAIVLSTVPGAEAAALVAEKIVQSVSQPIDVGGKMVHVGASVGIALFPEHAREANPLLACADMAMYWVKEHGRNSFSFSKNPKIDESGG
ncbi:MAG: diguanylate cyclase [Magnetococcales bacterium]|nr:diguanylate cyclase [Magnetococcales bacterium]